MNNKTLRKGAKKELFKVNVTELSLCINRSRTWTSQVLYGHEESSVTLKLIAEALGVNIEDLPLKSKKKAA